jgi:predicted membrane protein
MNWGRFFFGGLVVAAGVVLLLDNMGSIDAGEVFSTWWPVIVILAGLISLIANPRQWVVPLVVMVVGAALLLWTLGVVDSLDLVVPALLILIGIFVIFGRARPGSQSTDADRISTFNVFSGSEIASHSQQFKGGNISVVFGGAEIDLRDAAPAPEATIDVFAAFGGIEIHVPQGWQVMTKGFPIFGGFDNVTTKDRVASDAPTLLVSATILFGGVEISH